MNKAVIGLALALGLAGCGTPGQPVTIPPPAQTLAVAQAWAQALKPAIDAGAAAAMTQLSASNAIQLQKEVALFDMAVNTLSAAPSTALPTNSKQLVLTVITAAQVIQANVPNLTPTEHAGVAAALAALGAFVQALPPPPAAPVVTVQVTK